MKDTFGKAKFTLIELLTILMLVGLIFIVVVPVIQNKINQTRTNKAIEVMTTIGEKAEEFKNNPDNGYYPFDLTMLTDLPAPDTTFFKYTISSDDSTLVAETTKAFGKKGAFIIYNLPGKVFQVGKDENDALSKKVINENWLP